WRGKHLLRQNPRDPGAASSGTIQALARRAWPRLSTWFEGIEDRDAGRLEIRHVACHDGEAVFERGCGDHEVGALVAKCCAQQAPASRSLQLEGENSLAIEDQHLVEPHGEYRGKAGVGRALPSNTTLDLADADDADKKIGRSLR